MKPTLMDNILASSNKENEEFIDLSLDISDRVDEILKRKKWTRKHLAKEMDKSESEISKILAGGHNISLRMLAKLHTALGERVIHTTHADTEMVSNIFISHDYKGTFKIPRSFDTNAGMSNIHKTDSSMELFEEKGFSVIKNVKFR